MKRTRLARIVLVLAVLAVLVVLVAACKPTRAPRTTSYQQSRGPEVSESCLAGAHQGDVFASVPSRVRSFGITRDAKTLTLKRAGRTLTPSEGETLFRVVNERALPMLPIASASSALYSVHSCADVPRASCLFLEGWICQTTVDRIAEELEAALDAAKVADGELVVSFVAHEAGGPRCKKGSKCVPNEHYGAPRGLFEPDAIRDPTEPYGSGRCKDDGDCEGPGNVCQAWYLRGAAELLLYMKKSEPTWCGCVDGGCTWFVQP
jgi:hypothetical protein